jgi:hypothetical protein
MAQTRTKTVMQAAAAMYHSAVGCSELSVDEAWDDCDDAFTRDEYIRMARVAVVLVLRKMDIGGLSVGECLCPSQGLAHDAIIGTETNQSCRRCGGEI